MSQDPQEALLDVARDIVAKRGYVGLTLRTASAAAGVTPDVARRYYRNRESLFAAAMRLPADPVSAIPTLMAPGIEGMGERLVRFTLDTLRDPGARDDLMSLARTGVSAGHAVTGLQDFIEVSVVDRVAAMIGVPDARMRSALISSYLMGVATMRYGLRLEPLASASDEEVIRMVAPVIQDLLDPRRPIPGSSRARAAQSAKEPTGQAPAAGPAPSQDPRRTRTFDPDPAATRARRAARLAEEAAVARERVRQAQPPAAAGDRSAGRVAPDRQSSAGAGMSAEEAPAAAATRAARLPGGMTSPPASRAQRPPVALQESSGAASERPGGRASARRSATGADSVEPEPATKPTTAGPTASEPAAEETPASKAPTTKAPATRASAEKAPAKAPATKAPAEKAPAKKAPAEKAPATKAPATKAPATKTTATRAPATKEPPGKTSAGRAPDPGADGSAVTS